MFALRLYLGYAWLPLSSQNSDITHLHPFPPSLNLISCPHVFWTQQAKRVFKVEQIRPKRCGAVIRWVEPREWVDKNRTRCHILCDHCHKTWHIRDMWQAGDNVSRGWFSGKMIAKQDLNFVYNQLKGRVRTVLWNWVTGLSLCHKTLKTLFFVRDCMKAPGAARSDLGMAPVPGITRSWLPIQSRVWCQLAPAKMVQF